MLICVSISCKKCYFQYRKSSSRECYSKRVQYRISLILKNITSKFDSQLKNDEESLYIYMHVPVETRKHNHVSARYSESKFQFARKPNKESISIYTLFPSLFPVSLSLSLSLTLPNVIPR